MIIRLLKASMLIGTLAATLSACVSAPAPKDYSAFTAEKPRSILVVPTLNNTASVTAPEFFLSTVSRPFAERGYYVFPVNMVNGLLANDGLADPGLVHSADPTRLGAIFGCDSVLYININRWDSKYVVIATTTTVQFDYKMKSCKTGATLWETTQAMSYSPQASSSGNPLADLIAQAVTAALEKGAPNYMPLAMQANALAAGIPGQGVPSGPYLETK